MLCHLVHRFPFTKIGSALKSDLTKVFISQMSDRHFLHRDVIVTRRNVFATPNLQAFPLIRRGLFLIYSNDRKFFLSLPYKTTNISPTNDPKEISLK